MGGDREFVGLELGGVFDFLAAESVFEFGDEGDKGFVGVGDLGVEFRSIGTALSIAFGELVAEGDFVVEGSGDWGFERIEGTAVGGAGRSGVFGVVAEFLVFEEFQNLLGFEDSSLGKKEVGERTIGFGD